VITTVARARPKNQRFRVALESGLLQRCGAVLVLAGGLALAPSALYAQGCSQCAQAVGQTPPATQAAYRRGILVLVVAAGSVFTSALIVLKRFR
jgi:hypothetical protein